MWNLYSSSATYEPCIDEIYPIRLALTFNIFEIHMVAKNWSFTSLSPIKVSSVTFPKLKRLKAELSMTLKSICDPHYFEDLSKYSHGNKSVAVV